MGQGLTPQARGEKVISRFFTFIGLFLTVSGIILLIAGSRALAEDLSGPWDGPTAEEVWLPQSPHAKRASGKRVTSFRSWKVSKVSACNDRLKLLRKRLSTARAKQDGHTAKMIEQDITQEKWRVEVAKDLTVKDYISLYVIPQMPAQGARRRFKEIANTMNKDEVAQVLETYVQMLNPPQTAQAQPRLQSLSSVR